MTCLVIDNNLENNLTQKDVVDTGKEIAKTTIVWTIAGILTQLVRYGLTKITKGK
jgi:hypothetical protein